MSTESMPVPAKKSPRSNHKFATYVLHIAGRLSEDASYANADPSPAKLKTLADELMTANAKARHGGPAAVAERDAIRKDIEEQLDFLVTFVRWTVRTLALDPANATTKILGTGFSLRKKGRAPKPPLAAKHGDGAGEIVLAARAVAKAAVYYWEYSVDQVTWMSASETMKARTTIAGLTPGQVYAFRFRARTRKGLRDASNVVTLRAL